MLHLLLSDEMLNRKETDDETKRFTMTISLRENKKEEGRRKEEKEEEPD